MIWIDYWSVIFICATLAVLTLAVLTLTVYDIVKKEITHE